MIPPTSLALASTIVESCDLSPHSAKKMRPKVLMDTLKRDMNFDVSVTGGVSSLTSPSSAESPSAGASGVVSVAGCLIVCFSLFDTFDSLCFFQN